MKQGRIKTFIGIIIILLLAIILVGCTSDNVVENNNTANNVGKDTTKYNCTDIKTFWANFRGAIISKDYNEIKKYVKFSLQTRGPLDHDPIIEVSEGYFEKVFTEFLKQPTASSKETIFDWIKRNEMPEMKNEVDYDNASSYIDLVFLKDNWARFSDMIIEKDDDGYWKLSFIYKYDKDYKEKEDILKKIVDVPTINYDKKKIDKYIEKIKTLDLKFLQAMYLEDCRITFVDESLWEEVTGVSFAAGVYIDKVAYIKVNYPYEEENMTEYIFHELGHLIDQYFSRR